MFKGKQGKDTPHQYHQQCSPSQSGGDLQLKLNLASGSAENFPMDIGELLDNHTTIYFL